MGRDIPAGNGDRQTNSGGIWRPVWRGLRVSRGVVMVLLLAASLAANAALFVGGVLFNVIDEAVESVTGLATATGKQRKLTDRLKRKNHQLAARNRSLQNRVTEVRRERSRLTARNRSLQNRVIEIRQESSRLAARNRSLQNRVTELRREGGRLKDRMARLRQVTNAAVKRTVARSANAAVRVVATAPGKAVPYLGTAVVLGAAGLEIRDLCNTVRDMKAIQREIDPTESHSEDERKICGMDVPTKEQILSQIETVPLDAWQRSREFLTDLDPIPPEFETWLSRWWNDKGLFRDGMRGLRRMLRGTEEVKGEWQD